MAEPDETAFGSGREEDRPIGAYAWQRRGRIRMAAANHHLPQRGKAVLHGAGRFGGVKAAAVRVVMIAGGVVGHGGFRARSAVLYGWTLFFAVFIIFTFSELCIFLKKYRKCLD